jgi:hypothetical protein
LKALHRLQAQGRQTIRSENLKRAERELLVKNGFLQEVMKGWYIPARPDLADGESTAWYASYWGFVREYLTERFDAQWALSPEQSLLLHAGEWTVPTQLLVRARGGRNRMTRFLHGTSVLDVNLEPPAGEDVTELRGLRLYTPEAALIAASPQVFANQPTAVRTILATQRDASTVLGRLLEGGHSVIAGRIAGAFRNIGRDREADAILGAMRAAGYDVREKDPFDARLPHGPYRRDPSPYVHRIRLMWEAMRGEIPSRFPQPPGRQDGPVPDERHDGGGRLSLDGDPGAGARPLHGCAGGRQRGRGHRSLHDVPGRAGRSARAGGRRAVILWAHLS